MLKKSTTVLCLMDMTSSMYHGLQEEVEWGLCPKTISMQDWILPLNFPHLSVCLLSLKQDVSLSVLSLSTEYHPQHKTKFKSLHKSRTLAISSNKHLSSAENLLFWVTLMFMWTPEMMQKPANSQIC